MGNINLKKFPRCDMGRMIREAGVFYRMELERRTAKSFSTEI